MKKYIKKPTLITIYRLWIKEEAEQAFKDIYDLKELFDISDRVGGFVGYTFYDWDQKIDYFIYEKNAEKLDVSNHVKKDKNETAICIDSGRKKWLIDKQYFEQNYLEGE